MVDLCLGFTLHPRGGLATVLRPFLGRLQSSHRGRNSCFPTRMSACKETVSKSGNRIMTSLLDVRLIPFYLSVGVYFFLYQPYLHHPPDTVDSAIVKAIPIWSLALFVHNVEDAQQMPYAKAFVLGLFVSSLGDMCLIWRQTLFIPGMLFFAVAHVLYLFGLAGGFDFKKTRMGILFLLLMTCLYLFISTGIDSVLMKGLVLVYHMLIFGVGWLAFERLLCHHDNSALFAASGSALFMLSDLLIAVDKWKFPVPMSEVSIMTSYYSAQLCLALAAVKE